VIEPRSTATAWAPASVSNLGPGFDALGAALSFAGDTVSVTRTDGGGCVVQFDPLGAWSGPTDPSMNTAALAALRVGELAGYTGGLFIKIRKGLKAGTGLGSSAASSVAAAVAANALFGSLLSPHELINPVMHGESAVSGSPHGDNVLPSLFGGFVLGRSRSPLNHVRIQGWDGLHLAIILPDIQVLTRSAREILPTSISLADAVDHASRLGLLVDALHRQDAQALATLAMSDQLIEPLRASLISVYDVIKQAALDAGALGCALSGSGPAMLAFSDDQEEAELIRQAMETACTTLNVECLTVIDKINNQGAHVIVG